MRVLGQVGKSGGKDKDARQQKAATKYLKIALLFLENLKKEKKNLPLIDLHDYNLHLELEYYQSMLEKHIDLLERRIIKGETIPHKEKIFSIFETYTEWITKGKQNPNVELGKNFQITTDQYHLIIDYKIMENEVDKGTVVALADRILQKNIVKSWSFDKGYAHFKRYLGLGVCAYNLHRIGAELIKAERSKLKLLKKAA